MKNQRFRIIYSQDDQAYMICILEDTETGKQYLLVSTEGSSTSICPL
ncbi:DUF6440 family protein [Methylomusa anaerophila]